MSESKASLRFDHREIAVIFSLFIFVSLLMFTVGILVGKGLAQAKYEGVLLHLPTNAPAVAAPEAESTADTNPGAPLPSSGTSVSTDAPKGPQGKELTTAKAEEPNEEKAEEKPAEKEKANGPAVASNGLANEAGPTNATAGKNVPLELVPKNAKPGNLAGNSLREPGRNAETEALLKNPKLRALVDNEKDPAGPTVSFGAAKRGAASTAPPSKAAAPANNAVIQSLASGPFTVQVGSYPTEKDAAERVEALKKLGFSHSYFSAKQWSDTKETWYRVWLGYYPDYESAKRSGRTLQERGEVTNYLVRKTDAAK